MAEQDDFFILFSRMKFICADGKMLAAHEALLRSDNRSFRYGDGLFETMKMLHGKILMKELHFRRLFNSLSTLGYNIPSSFTESLIGDQIYQLAEKNGCSSLCRVRLTLYRGNGNLYPVPATLNYLAECIALNETVSVFNEKGLIIDVFPDAYKTCDRFSAIKSANFLPYVMGTMHAAKNNIDDCLVTNSKGYIADSTIANIFLVHEDTMSTPALTEGCIDGVMRRYLLEKFSQKGYTCTEKEISVDELEAADELFLTNSINGIRWVKQFRTKQFNNSFTRKIFQEFIEPIFALP
jgi:branched-chain amino acid aminotransferase